MRNVKPPALPVEKKVEPACWYCGGKLEVLEANPMVEAIRSKMGSAMGGLVGEVSYDQKYCKPCKAVYNASRAGRA